MHMTNKKAVGNITARFMTRIHNPNNQELDWTP